MSKPAAIMGSLTDVRNIAANKSVRLSIEVPAERAAEVLAIFGWPTGVNPISVAIARIDAAKANPEPSKVQDKTRRSWGGLTPAEQCGIRCNEAQFHAFLADRGKQFWLGIVSDLEGNPVAAAAAFVRQHCGVSSRKDIRHDAPSGRLWAALDGDYDAWLRYGATA